MTNHFAQHADNQYVNDLMWEDVLKGLFEDTTPQSSTPERAYRVCYRSRFAHPFNDLEVFYVMAETSEQAWDRADIYVCEVTGLPSNIVSVVWAR